MKKDFTNFCLGTVQFGKQYGLSNLRSKTININEVEKIFDFFYSNNGKHIDTARNYGNSEMVISNFLQPQSKVTSKFQINSDNELISQIENSLQDLKIEQLDTALIHNPEDLINDKKSFDRLLLAKSRGLCKKIGLSVYSFSDLKNIEDIFLIDNIDVIQVQGNAFDKDFFRNKKISLLKSNNIRIDIRSIFLQGLLLQNLDTSLKLFPGFAEEVHSWHSYCVKNDLSPLRASLSNVAKLYDGECLFLFGCRSVHEIHSILSAMKKINMLEPLFDHNVPKKLSDPRLWKN